MKNLVAAILLALLPAPALAWNEHGHMVVARLAWNQLSPDQRAKVLAKSGLVVDVGRRQLRSC